MKLDKPFWQRLMLFWIIAGVLLFINGLRYGHWEIAVVRNVYLPVIGAILCVPISLLIEYHRGGLKKQSKLWVILIGTAILSAVLMAVFLNPLTLSLLGAGPENFTLSALTNQMVVYFLLFVAWGWLSYTQFTDKQESPSDLHDDSTANDGYCFELNDRGNLLKISSDSVMAITANGDYVNYHTQAKNYMSSGRMQELAESLKPYGFKRIHRSTLINQQYVDSVIKLGKGKFRVCLINGLTYESSKTWESNVKSLIPVES